MTLGALNSVEEYEEELGYLEGLVQETWFKSSITIGDFNGDSSFSVDSQFGRKVRCFMESNNMHIVKLDELNDASGFATWNPEMVPREVGYTIQWCLRTLVVLSNTF